MQLRRASESERAKFAKEAARYRNFDRKLPKQMGQGKQLASNKKELRRNKQTQLNDGDANRRIIGKTPRANSGQTKARTPIETGRRRANELSTGKRITSLDENKRRQQLNRMLSNRGTATGKTQKNPITGKTQKNAISSKTPKSPVDRQQIIRRETAKPWSSNRWDRSTLKSQAGTGQLSTKQANKQLPSVRQNTQPANKYRGSLRTMTPRGGPGAQPNQGSSATRRLQSTPQFRRPTSTYSKRGSFNTIKPQANPGMRARQGQSTTRRLQSAPQVRRNSSNQMRRMPSSQFKGRAKSIGGKRGGK